MKKQDKIIEDFLEKYLQLEDPSPGVDSGDDSVLRAISRLPSYSSMRPSIPFWVSMAAMCLTVIGVLSIRSTVTNEKRISQDRRQQHEKISSRNEFRVIRSFPAEQIVIIQTFDSFEIQQREAGQALGDGTLVRVDNDSFTLRNSEGSTIKIEIDKNNKKAGQTLQRELQNLAANFQAGQWTSTDWGRLLKIAHFGDTEAIRLLEKIAASSSEYLKEASPVLERKNEWTHIRQFVYLALDPDASYRKKIVQELGVVQNPLTLSALRTIILRHRESEEIRLLAAKTLAAMSGKEVKAIVKKLSENPEVPEKIKTNLQYESSSTETADDRR